MHSRALKVLRTLHSSIFRDAGMISSSVGLNGTPDLPADRANKQTNKQFSLVLQTCLIILVVQLFANAIGWLLPSFVS